MRTCTKEGCGRKHVAKGLCSTHYNKAKYPSSVRHRKREVPCAACGATVLKYVGENRYQPTCSYRCRYFVTFGRWPAGQELVGPLPKPQRETVPPIVEIPSTSAGFLSGPCAWCGTAFTQDLRITGVPMRYCSKRCAKRQANARYDAIRGRFNISPRERLAIYERDAWMCQLCNEPVDPSLPPTHRWAATLDHVVCQSWTLIPDHSASNLRLSHRMCNSVRGDSNSDMSYRVA